MSALGDELICSIENRSSFRMNCFAGAQDGERASGCNGELALSAVRICHSLGSDHVGSALSIRESISPGRKLVVCFLNMACYADLVANIQQEPVYLAAKLCW